MSKGAKKRYQDIFNNIISDIKSGKYGASGERFLTTAELAKQYMVSLVTAQHLMNDLKNKRFIRLVGKMYYITYGRVYKGTPYFDIIKNDKKLIGIHITNLDDPYFAAMVSKIENEARAAGYHSVIMSSGYNAENEIEILAMFEDMGACGVISSPGIWEGTTELYERLTLSCAFIGRELKNAHISSVLPNSLLAAKNVAKHLVKMGYNEFAYIGMKISSDEDVRFSGFCEGLNEEGFKLAKENIILMENIDQDILRRKLNVFLNNVNKPLGIFCFHDLFAIQLVQICNMMKISIPKDVGIVGFDNLPMTLCVTPTITTVGYSYDVMAKQVVSMLLKQMDSLENKKEIYYVAPSLNVRESTSLNSGSGKNEFPSNLIFHNL